MSTNKTQPTTDNPADFIAAVEPLQRREDAQTLLSFFQEVTGFEPVLWGSIIGFGQYHYEYASGRQGDFLATGFSPRKANMSLYIMPGYQDYQEILARLGPHKTGKACLYITRLEQVEMAVLGELIQVGLKDLAKLYPVQPS